MKDRTLLTLALLDAQNESGIEGRTRLQKLLFLIQQRLDQREESFDKGYDFVAYDYGPFSKEIYQDIDYLIERGFLAEHARKLDDGIIKYEYNLTEKGEDYIEESFPELGERHEVVQDVTNEFANEELQNIIDYVYSRYPEYAENSVLY
ncbi:type II toxin-antitoxin system antitoxin SocA domain-containing protein [Haloarcula sp. JP-L23]|uniref:type II toxin-antitoxin system antitoxin SocA domain-containing protein n=1 Tax=Haloarcula sp. JP-L23 TaxID=2716717 RepID=UPI00140E9B8A|nr:DUF4065 domain-containing protein [Haloarcula sp. JP-L23]